MRKKEGLQKVTKPRAQEIVRLSNSLAYIPSIPDSGKLDKKESAYIARILMGPVLTRKWLEKLPTEKRQYFIKTVTRSLNILAGDDRDRLVMNTTHVLHEDTRRNIWEFNHAEILKAIDFISTSKGRFPFTTEIAQITGLSRPTVDRHLKEYQNSPQYKQRQEEFVMMRENVLARVYYLAINGNVKAMQVFLNFTGPSPVRIGSQTNYIQYNSLTITEDDLKRLPPDKVGQISEIINSPA